MQATSQLHPLISNAALPPALLKPLRFGDPDQIRALYQLDRMIEDMTADADREGVPPEAIKKYQVTVSIEAEMTFEVLATSRDHAEEKAREEFADQDVADMDFDTDYYVREIKSVEV